MKIIIVDDNLTRALGLAEYLSAAGLCLVTDVEICNCVDIAKNRLEVMYFDALILDVVLPKRNNEIPTAQHGISLLGQINRSSRLLKPEKIIGITGYLDDIAKFKNEFEQYCLTVIEARVSDSHWKKKVVDALLYTASSRLARAVSEQNIHILSIHGIRTFGEWQTRLPRLIANRLPGIKSSSYKYGYFSALAFLLPIFSELEKFADYPISCRTYLIKIQKIDLWSFLTASVHI